MPAANSDQSTAMKLQSSRVTYSMKRFLQVSKIQFGKLCVAATCVIFKLFTISGGVGSARILAPAVRKELGGKRWIEIRLLECFQVTELKNSSH